MLDFSFKGSNFGKVIEPRFGGSAHESNQRPSIENTKTDNSSKLSAGFGVNDNSSQGKLTFQDSQVMADEHMAMILEARASDFTANIALLKQAQKRFNSTEILNPPNYIKHRSNMRGEKHIATNIQLIEKDNTYELRQASLECKVRDKANL